MRVKTVWKNIRRSPYQAAFAIMISLITFLVFSMFAVAFYTTSRVVDYFESRPQVTAFFRDEAKKEDIDSLAKTLKDSGLISSTKYVSKEDALKIYQQQFKDEPLLLDLVTAEILPASLEISTYKIEDLALVSDTLKKSTIIQEVVFQKDVVSTLTSWINTVRAVGIILVSLLALLTIAVIIVITETKVSSKRKDIETMRLIGAGSWYIRWPFILEGIFYGIIGSVIGWAISVGILLYLTPHLASFMRGIPVFPLPPLFLLGLLLVEVMVATVLGALSSYLAAMKYLK